MRSQIASESYGASISQFPFDEGCLRRRDWHSVETLAWSYRGKLRVYIWVWSTLQIKLPALFALTDVFIFLSTLIFVKTRIYAFMYSSKNICTLYDCEINVTWVLDFEPHFQANLNFKIQLKISLLSSIMC